jgi:hypothetical protein
VRKRDRIAKFVGFYAPPALKRDLCRLARTEDRSLSAIVCGLLRLGICRYFELADEKMAAPLLAAMRDVFGDPFGSKTGANAMRARLAGRAADAAEFDEAIEIGKREFAQKYEDGSRPFRRT